MIINAENKIIGRFATVAAKKALLGESVDIVNCENAYVTGRKGFLFEDFKRKKDMGTFKGPFMSRMPDRFVKRMIRGMLPYKQEKGKNALKRIKCHIGVPKELEGKEQLDIKEADVSKVQNRNYVTVKQICEKLGAKYE